MWLKYPTYLIVLFNLTQVNKHTLNAEFSAFFCIKYEDFRKIIPVNVQFSRLPRLLGTWNVGVCPYSICIYMMGRW